jgi:hypothetical protein
MSFGVDLAWGRPSITSLKNAGVTFVCRYLSHDTSGKNLDHAEAQRYSDAGIWVVVVWESTASRALGGHAAGVKDAQDAAAQAKACGIPAGRPIYFAVDFDANAREIVSVNAYLDGAASVLGKARTGVYGSSDVVKTALDSGHCEWAWATYAWSGGKLDGRSHIYQYSNDHTIGGVGLDYDRALKADYGQWKVGISPSVDPTPPPQPTEEDDMPTGELKAGLDTETCLTVRALPQGHYKTIGFNSDNGFQGFLPASLRVAFRSSDGWHVTDHVVVDSKVGQKVLSLPANCNGFSILHEGGPDHPIDPAMAGKVDVLGRVAVGFEVS